MPRALLILPALFVFALGLTVPVVAFSQRSHAIPATEPCNPNKPPVGNGRPGCQPTTPNPGGGDETTTTTTSTPPPPPPPELVPVAGRTAVVKQLRGVVRVRVPGSSRFKVLSSASLIPIGSDLDTRSGTVGVTTADTIGRQTGAFHSGMFKLEQQTASTSSAGAARIVTVLRLMGGSFSGCEADEDNTQAVIASIPIRIAPTRHRVVRRLWGSESGGSWSTVGGQAAATVRGTVWMTEDNCLGTYVRVRRGVVLVHDFRTGKTVRVTAGHSYLAVAPDPF
jgi:hypothetical protein